MQKYIRLVNLFVKSELRDEIKSLKKEKTYDEFIRNLIKKENGEMRLSPDSKNQSTKKGASNECKTS